MARLGSFDVGACGPTSFDVTNDIGGWFDRDWIPSVTPSGENISGWYLYGGPGKSTARRRRWKTVAERAREKDDIERLKALAVADPQDQAVVETLARVSAEARLPYVYALPRNLDAEYAELSGLYARMESALSRIDLAERRAIEIRSRLR
jgi:hypothetical protein